MPTCSKVSNEPSTVRVTLQRHTDSMPGTLFATKVCSNTCGGP